MTFDRKEIAMMNERVYRIFSIANEAMTMAADRARITALDNVDDPIEQLSQEEDFLRNSFDEIGLTLDEAVNLATSYVEEAEDYDLMEAANFLQFFA